MPRLLVITHPEVVVDPATPIPEWRLSDLGRQRAAAFAVSDTFSGVSHIWSSAERKARETAEILASARGIPIQVDARLGENDRSATGFLPPDQFETAADTFFAHPNHSFRGWERAIDAQSRIARAVRDITTGHRDQDLAIVTHGAVGTLLYCHLTGLRIDRCHDQPSQGNYWSADLATCVPETGWRSIG